MLTAEQEKLCDVVVAEYDAVLDDLPRPKKTAINRWLKLVYSFYDKPAPSRVEVVPSPFAAFALAEELTGEKYKTLDYCGMADAGWVSFYDYAHRAKFITKEEAKDVLALREFQRSCWDSLLLDECAIVVALPTTLERDTEGNLHSPTGPCIEWADGHADYAWHGVWVPEQVIRAPRTYTKTEYAAITDTEVRRALGEAAGWDFIVDLLGAKSTNTWTDPNTELEYALYRTANQAWLRKQSPVLQNGKQPFYFEPVHESLVTAQAARKWQATRLTPEQCEADPVLVYGTET